MSFLRRSSRLCKVVFVFVYSIVEVLWLRPKSRADRAAWLGRIGRRLLTAVDVTCSTVGEVPMQGAVISNHLTYVDIALHAALRPCVFVSKSELRATPVLGWISMMAGTVYVARGSGGSAAKAGEGMAAGFHDRLPVAFFPEGTTGVGDVPVLPFRSGLIAQTLAAGEPMRYGYIRYRLSPQDVAAGRTLRQDVYWGPQTLWAHIWNFLGLRQLHATITFAPQPIAFSPEAMANRKIAAQEAETAVVALGQTME